MEKIVFCIGLVACMGLTTHPMVKTDTKQKLTLKDLLGDSLVEVITEESLDQEAANLTTIYAKLSPEKQQSFMKSVLHNLVDLKQVTIGEYEQTTAGIENAIKSLLELIQFTTKEIKSYQQAFYDAERGTTYSDLQRLMHLSRKAKGMYDKLNPGAKTTILEHKATPEDARTVDIYNFALDNVAHIRENLAESGQLSQETIYETDDYKLE